MPALSPIIPPEKIIAGMTLDMGDMLTQAQFQAPPGKPDQILFVQENIRAAVPSECHDNKISGHPGVTKMCKIWSWSVWWQL